MQLKRENLDISIEEEMFKKVSSILQTAGIPYIHIPNQVFKNPKLSRSVKFLKFVPDFIFPCNNNVCMLELGEKGKHQDQKKNQKFYMNQWSLRGNTINAIVYDFYELNVFFKRIGFLF